MGWCTVVSPRMPYVMMPQPVEDRSIYKGQIFAPKERLFMVLISIKSHQIFVYNSTKCLLKLKCKQLSGCSWSLHAEKGKEDELWEIKKSKGSTYVNSLMNRDHHQLEVLYIYTIHHDKAASYSENVSLNCYMQPVVTQITDSSSCTYRKAWLAKQKVIVDLFGDWVTSIACCLHT